MKEVEKLVYSKEDTMFIIYISQEISDILIEENIIDIDIYYLASICIGLYETYKKDLLENKLTEEEKKDIGIFIFNNRQSIKFGVLKLIERFKEQDELNQQNILYN